MDDPVGQDLIDFAGRLADAAARVIRPRFRTPLDVDTKSDHSPVTLADRGAETAMRELIQATYPDHGILGEEFGAERLDADHLWILDPIDGTKSFITGSPLFGTLVGLWRAGRPVLGIINQPISGERWLGVEGRRTVLNGRPVATRKCPDLGQAALYSWGSEGLAGALGPRLHRLADAVSLVRHSADCYAYGLLALGTVDMVADYDMKAYDFAALVPVVEGAGGAIRDWRGRPLRLDGDGTVLAVGDPDRLADGARLLAPGPAED